MAPLNQSAQRPMRQQPRNFSKDAKHIANGRRVSRDVKRDDRHDEATVAYVKRVLCPMPQHRNSSTDSSEHSTSPEPLEDLLPPLTSSNAIDLQLYALIAAILSNFVQTWYNQITPDQEFVSEVVQIIAHCTRGLESRLRHVDLEALVLDELPDLVAEHVNAVRASQTTRAQSVTPHERRIRYHTLRPHMALEPVPNDAETSLALQDNETAFSLLLVNRVLPLLLPPQDLQNPCLEVLVSEVFAELVIRGGVCNKASEPCLLWDGITKVLQAMRTGQASSPAPTRADRLEEFGLLSSKQAPKGNGARRGHTVGRLDILARTFWLVVQSSMTAWLFLRALFFALVQASQIPPRSDQPSSSFTKKSSELTNNRRDVSTTDLSALDPIRSQRVKRPFISMHIWGCTSQLLSLNRRMPWLTGILSLVQWVSLHGPGQICRTDSRLDRLLSNQVHTHLLTASRLPTILQAARTALFPDNALAPARIPPTSDEILTIRRHCAESIVDAIPHVVRTRFFATDDVSAMVDEVEEELDLLLGDQYINKHLMIGIVGLIVVRLFPELATEAADGGAPSFG